MLSGDIVEVSVDTLKRRMRIRSQGKTRIQKMTEKLKRLRMIMKKNLTEDLLGEHAFQLIAFTMMLLHKNVAGIVKICKTWTNTARTMTSTVTLVQRRKNTV